MSNDDWIKWFLLITVPLAGVLFLLEELRKWRDKPPGAKSDEPPHA